MTNNESYYKKALENILKKDIKVGVIGLGYVGLPLLAHIASKNCNCTGYDKKDVIKNLKTRETFTPTEEGKKRQQYLDRIRKQDITKILARDKRILDWWKSI